MAERDRHAGGEQEQRPVGGVEDPAEQEVAQSEETAERERELKGGDGEGEQSSTEGGS
jgi:hypothetical protein